MTMTENIQILRVGIIGAGEVAQAVHLPTLAMLTHLYTVVAICDISPKAVEHCKTKFKIPFSTTDPYELISLSNVDLIFNLTSDQYHAPYAVAALKAGKNVMMEKPLTLSIKSGLEIMEAEKAAGGPRVFVGTMRRYAPSFTQAFKREVSSIPRILYARSRGIIGPNSHFVPQGGCFPVRFNDIPKEAALDFNETLDALLKESLGENGMTEERIEYWRFLGSLGSHDLSLMREVLGNPESVAAVSVNHPFYSAMFNYRNKSGEPFSCTYETGIDGVPRFDSHLAIYGERKTVIIQYDTPYVKGLPIKVKVDELVNGEAVSREVLTTFEDAYTVEMQEMHTCFTEGKEIKTSVEDSMNDLRLWTMMLQVHERNSGLNNPGKK
jgi:predicted dehydrogenase